ncbi:MAG: hypothetical protein MJK10_06255 [Pseudomonadales bacterium]|nr:hypothetical protein [Pseudomonadales bacterium]NRA14104.1 hypothetical protein [Oceanospirillaceae bacterium]
MYNLDFIYPYAGITSLPPEIDRARLFNVSFDIDTGDIKLYILDKSERFAHKVSKTGISRQYSGADPEYGADPRRLNAFLGEQFDYRQITIDAVEGDTYYVYMEEGKGPEYQRFVTSYCQRFNISVEQLLNKVSRINNRSYSNLEQCSSARAISMLRIPLDATESKVYAQPFLYGDGFPLNQRTEEFLLQLFSCNTTQLQSKLRHVWVVTEMTTDRTLLVTQYHDLLHKT